MALFKPMRAATLPATSFDSPFDASVFWASPKLDGIRAVVREGTIQTRKLKPVPNPLIRGLFEEHYAQLKNLDGELMVQNGTFSDTQSFVMSKTVDEDVRVFFHVFDTFSSPARPYKERYALIKEYLQTLPAHFSHRGFYLYVSLVEQKPAVRTPAELLRVALKDGH